MPEATLRQIERQRRFFSPLVVCTFCAALTTLAWFAAHRASSSENNARFERSASSVLFSFKSRMSFYTNALIYTRNLFNLKPDLSSQEFATFVRGMNLKDEFPGIQTVGYVRRFSRSQLLQNLKTLPPKAQELVREKRDSYDVVVFVESLMAVPTTAIGMDLAVSPERLEKMNLAATLGVPIATDRVIRISDPKASPTEHFFMVFVPHYKTGAPVSNPEERQKALLGFVYGGFRAPVLFGNLGGDRRLQDHRLVFQVYDGNHVDPANLVFSKGDVAAADLEFYKEIGLEAAEHEWTIVLGALKGFSPAYSRLLPLLLLLVGGTLTAAVTVAARNSKRYAEKLQEDIMIRRQAEAQLQEEKQIVELTSKIGTTLKAEQDLESIVQLVTDLATNLTGARYGAFFYSVLNEAGENLMLFSLSGVDKSEFAKFGMPRSTPLFRPTFEGTGVVRIDDLTKDERFGQMDPYRGMLEGHLAIRSYLSVPVISKTGQILGGLIFGHPQPGLFSARSEAIVRSLSIQAASAMDNATLYRELTRARAAADSANKAKSLFLANVSHEIRTPLGVMLGFAELTSEHRHEPDVVDENVRKILRSGRELSRIIGEVLDLSKIEANALLIENSTFSLAGFLEEIRSDWQARIEAKGLRFELEIKAGLPEKLRTDSTRLNQIIVNLLSNALKFTEKGSIQMQVSGVDGGVHGKKLRIEVTDSGLGISEEHKALLFKAFSQGDSSITRKYGGSGLGLALSRQLARALGGELELASSTLGQGSVFALTLPSQREPSQDLEHTAKKALSPTLLDSVRVLLVEDSLDNQILISTFLSKAKATVETASNGEEGVQKALASDYDIVLMDIQMPVLDGYGAFEKLKASGYRKPVIALTAHALIEEKERAFELGFFGYLTKPVNRQTLVSTIAEAVLS